MKFQFAVTITIDEGAQFAQFTKANGPPTPEFLLECIGDVLQGWQRENFLWLRNRDDLRVKVEPIALALPASVAKPLGGAIIGLLEDVARLGIRAEGITIATRQAYGCAAT